MLSKLKLSILVLSNVRAGPLGTNNCVESEACNYINAPQLTDTILDDVYYADGSMTQIIHTNEF